MVWVVDHLGGPTVGTQDEDRVGRSFVIVARTKGSWTDQGLPARSGQAVGIN